MADAPLYPPIPCFSCLSLCGSVILPHFATGYPLFINIDAAHQQWNGFESIPGVVFSRRSLSIGLWALEQCDQSLLWQSLREPTGPSGVASTLAWGKSRMDKRRQGMSSSNESLCSRVRNTRGSDIRLEPSAWRRSLTRNTSSPTQTM
jgi:hypothetical protein